MKSVSTRVDDRTHEEIEAIVSDRGSTMSATARDLIEKGLEYDDALADLEAELGEEIAKLEADIEERDEEIKDLSIEVQRVHNEKRQLLEQREQHTDLVEYVEQQREKEPSRWDRVKQAIVGR